MAVCLNVMLDVVLHIVMVDLEETCIEKLSFRPALYKRYGDDIIIALPSDRIKKNRCMPQPIQPHIKILVSIGQNYGTS